MRKDATVGEMRQQAAFKDADAPLVLVSSSEKIHALIERHGLRVVRVYPDTAHEGTRGSVFKIEIESLFDPTEEPR